MNLLLITTPMAPKLPGFDGVPRASSRFTTNVDEPSALIYSLPRVQWIVHVVPAVGGGCNLLMFRTRPLNAMRFFDTEDLQRRAAPTERSDSDRRGTYFAELLLRGLPHSTGPRMETIKPIKHTSEPGITIRLGYMHNEHATLWSAPLQPQWIVVPYGRGGISTKTCGAEGPLRTPLHECAFNVARDSGRGESCIVSVYELCRLDEALESVWFDCAVWGRWTFGLEYGGGEEGSYAGGGSTI
ncbi:hypothetical protein BKA83DRAFT_4123738 [Pisolithus microcarpus]|nr:hypothetical protein BKA83DRAFT_4123738 [Pisolithus microcarpus]